MHHAKYATVALASLSAVVLGATIPPTAAVALTGRDAKLHAPKPIQARADPVACSACLAACVLISDIFSWEYME